MKRSLGLLIVLVILVASCGCTIKQANVTPTPPTTVQITGTAATAAETTAPQTIVPESAPVTTTTATAPATVTTASTTRPAMPPSTRVTTVHIRNNTYIPDQLTVLPGTRVAWINDDPGTHVVKSTGAASGKFTSAELINGAEFGYTFGEATGTFEFMDPAHPEMKGAIIVRTGQTLWVATFAPTTAAP